MRYIILLVAFIGTTIAQDFTEYKNKLDEGNVDDVLLSVPQLESKYPDHPFILYLQAVQMTDGEKAFAAFHAITEESPGTYAAELSDMKIGEYLYAKGLYSQASVQFRQIPLNYPGSANIPRAIDLMKKSYLATGELDSLEYYTKLINGEIPITTTDATTAEIPVELPSPQGIVFSQEKIPELQPTTVQSIPETDTAEYSYFPDVILIKKIPPVIKVQSTNEERLVANTQEAPNNTGFWVVQVGAFSELKNANIIKNRLEMADYKVEIVEIHSNSNKYSAVQIVRFSTAEDAAIVGKQVTEKFGLDFHLVERF